MHNRIGSHKQGCAILRCLPQVRDGYVMVHNCMSLVDCLPSSVFTEERQSPELYAANVRKVMGEALGAELSTHGIPQQQALKRNGIYVDWTGRYGSAPCSSSHPGQSAPYVLSNNCACAVTSA